MYSRSSKRFTLTTFLVGEQASFRSDCRQAGSNPRFPRCARQNCLTQGVHSTAFNTPSETEPLVETKVRITNHPRGIDGLGSANRMIEDAQNNFDACVVSVIASSQPSKQPKEAAQKACAGSFSWAERRTSLILSALAEMVKDPPLRADAPPTAESSQKWKDWWAKHRDKAVFVNPPRASYDWH